MCVCLYIFNSVIPFSLFQATFFFFVFFFKRLFDSSPILTKNEEVSETCALHLHNLKEINSEESSCKFDGVKMTSQLGPL